MKKIFIAAAAVVGLMVSACSGGGASHDVPQIDMVASMEMSDAPEFTYSDINYVPLDTATDALMGQYAQIMAVMGDTLIMHDMDVMGGNSRLLLFNLADGRFIREIKHIGQGPGEYSWIASVFPDRERGEVIISGGNFAVNRYTLSDSLVSTKKLAVLGSTKFPVGSLANGFNIAEPLDGDLLIHQYDADFNVVDTLFVPDYDPRYISMAINTSGDLGLMNVVDTVYSLLPGRMEPVVVLSRGDKALTPKVEQDVYLNQKDFKTSNEMRKRYIQFNDYILDGDNLLLSSYYGGCYYVDLYSLTDSKLLGRCVFAWDEEGSGFALPWGSTTFRLQKFPFLGPDGRYYMVVDDEQAVDADGNQNPDGNIGIISFNIE